MNAQEARKILVKNHYCPIHLIPMKAVNHRYECDQCEQEAKAEQIKYFDEALAYMKKAKL